MAASRLAVLTTVVGAPHARVLAARLGAEGIPVELKGMTSAIYPLLGPVDVLVREEHLPLAREILLADAVDAVFDGLPEAPPGGAGAPAAAGLGEEGSRRGTALGSALGRQGAGGTCGRQRVVVLVASLIVSVLLLAGVLVGLR